MNIQYLRSLVREFAALPGETEWLEFKCNFADLKSIGEYLSALSNSAALNGKHFGYIIWGIEDVGHAVSGTKFKPRQIKKGNQELESWLAMHLSPRIDFKIHEFTFDENPIVLFEIPCASHRPVSFKAIEYIRIGTCKKPLKDFPEKERLLWNLFDRLFRKAIRVIVYRGKNRVETIREQTGIKGYGPGFEGVISFVNDLLPENEIIDQALRKNVRMYPEIAIRELVANALIHQDFTIRGTGPMIEIFSDRMEITNPGIPLIDTLRFIDEPPQSRNEALASFMRRINICEERGSGIDKVIFQVEFFQLPAPNFIVTSNHTKSILYTHKSFSDMEKFDRIRACYQHACLKYVSNDFLTNTSLRERFSIAKKNYPMASRVIADTIEKKMIKQYNPENLSKKLTKYIPFWA